MKTLNKIEKAYKLNSGDFDFTSVDCIVAEEILVLKNGKAIAIYSESESVLYKSLDDLLNDHQVDISDYSESKSLEEFWNSDQKMELENA